MHKVGKRLSDTSFAKIGSDLVLFSCTYYQPLPPRKAIQGSADVNFSKPSLGSRCVTSVNGTHQPAIEQQRMHSGKSRVGTYGVLCRQTEMSA